MLVQSEFDKEIDRVFATFGKAVPSGRVKETLWDEVAEMDGVFFAQACEELRGMQALPQNLARFFVQAWDRWMASHKASPREDVDACAQGCEHGWFTLFDTRKPMAPYAFKCVCNTDLRFADQQAWTRAEIDELPFLSWEDPFRTRAQREAWLAKKNGAQSPEQESEPEPVMDDVPW